MMTLCFVLLPTVLRQQEYCFQGNPQIESEYPECYLWFWYVADSRLRMHTEFLRNNQGYAFLHVLLDDLFSEL